MCTRQSQNWLAWIQMCTKSRKFQISDFLTPANNQLYRVSLDLEEFSFGFQMNLTLYMDLKKKKTKKTPKIGDNNYSISIHKQFTLDQFLLNDLQACDLIIWIRPWQPNVGTHLAVLLFLLGFLIELCPLVHFSW